MAAKVPCPLAWLSMSGTRSCSSVKPATKRTPTFAVCSSRRSRSITSRMTSAWAPRKGSPSQVLKIRSGSSGTNSRVQ